MRLRTFSGRVARDILRDPLNLAFGLGFPLVVLFMLTAIQSHVPVDLFALPRLTPGITVFGMSFLTLFSATLVARDRETAFLQRLYTTPMLASDFILGYLLPLLPMALIQGGVCYVASIALGLSASINILYAMLGLLPVSLFFIALGLLCGSICGIKQVGGLCGALLTNLTAWLSGTWFDIELVGGTFKRVADLLPFVHAVELERALLAGNISGIWPHIGWVLGYAVAAAITAVVLFLRQMKKQ